MNIEIVDKNVVLFSSSPINKNQHVFLCIIFFDTQIGYFSLFS